MLTLAAFLVTLGVLVVVHELGHYSVARACGVKILRFSVGFGRTLVKLTRGADRTEWVIGVIPLGGYVRMLDERDPECGVIPPADLPRAFNRQPLASRTAIVLAGPVANLLLAIAVYAGLNLVGIAELRPLLDAPPAGSPAAHAGVQVGDLVTAVDGAAVRSWTDLRWRILEHSLDGQPLSLRLETTDGTTRDAELGANPQQDVDGDFFLRLGILPHPGRTVIGAATAGGAAEQAGLRAGDRIVSVDGVAVRYAREVAERVRAAPGQVLHLRLRRNGQDVDVAVAPQTVLDENHAPIGRIGVDFRETVLVRYGPVDSVRLAVGKTWDTATFSVRMLGRMLAGKASWRNLSGPVTIADYAGQSARIGWAAYFGFLALVSISLGVLNLLPVPMLDGGHLLYYAVELLKGSPPSDRVVAIGQRIGVAVLTLLTALALFNDVTRLIP